jgi:hypothetical protein
MAPTLPRLIALCGNPDSGKSTAAELLRDHYGYEIADDGAPARQIAMDYFGLSHDQVYTQAGKLEFIPINNRRWQVRDVLGQLLNVFEHTFGMDIVPQMVMRGFDPEKRYVMPSVRRNQGLYWRAQGALVIEVVNPAAPPSPYEFDAFNPEAVQERVNNNGLFRELHPVEARAELLDELRYALGIYDLLEQA